MKYRVITYLNMRSPSEVDLVTEDFGEASETLESLVKSRQVIGGRIEKYINGQGWVVAEEEEE